MRLNKQIDIAFIILHYNTIHETDNLVKSIYQKLNNNSFIIVIVDNGSPNGSGTTLKKTYSEKKEIVVLENEKNEGFAKGNNIGINYCREYLQVKYICCINNDTLIIDENFLYFIEREYEKSKAAVIGPKALLKDGSIQFSAFKLKSVEYYEELLLKYTTNKNDIMENMSYKNYLKKYPIVFKFLKNVKSTIRYIYLSTRHSDVVLHGSCLIFTPIFFEKLSGFDNRTFLYHEEELLYIELKKNGLNSIYSPRVKIKHLEDSATDSIVNSDEEKREFIRINEMQSLQILIHELKKGN